MIYLDNNATTPLAEEARELYTQALCEYGNASSVHALGQAARKRVNEARERVAGLLKIPELSLVFTSGGTESINAAMLGSFLPLGRKNHLIVSQVEHSSVLKCAEFLEKLGVAVTYLAVDEEGRIDPQAIEAAIRPETGLIAVMFVNNELGNIYPVKAIGEIARDRRVPFLCDAVQAAGRFEIDLSRLPVDLMAASAHKFHGPKGAGFLYIRPGIELSPLHLGGRQERGHRAGTENLPSIVAMAGAFEFSLKNLLQDERRIQRLRDRLETGLVERIPQFVVHGDLEHRSGNTLNFRIEGIPGESMLMNLDLAGIAASSGAACDSGSIEPSHVLLAMGLSREQASGGLRFSLSRYNTDAEIEEVLKVLPQLVERIRAVA